MPISRRFVFVLALAAAVAGGCDLASKPTKTAAGQLYTSGDGRYDPYFQAVHTEQVAAASWADEAKEARKPIITALDLRPGASNSTIFSATREKKNDASVGRAVDETTMGERDRAKKLMFAAERLEDLQKKGEELKKQAIEDRRNIGADRADEKKVAHKDELKREITAAVDAVESLAEDARKGHKEAREIARKLKGVWSGKEDDDDSEAKGEKKDDKAEKKKPEAGKKPKPDAPAKKAEKPEKPPADPPPAKPPADPPPAKPAASQKPQGEVFNP